MKRYIFSFIAALAALSLTPTTAQADGETDEHRFIVAVRDSTIPYAVIPGGRFATDDDVLMSGYRACAALDQHPNDATQRELCNIMEYRIAQANPAVHPLESMINNSDVSARHPSR